MADTKISDLTALTNANVAGADSLPIVDADAVETKQITMTELDKRYVEDPTTLATIASAGLAGADIMVVNDAGTDKSITITELDTRYDQSGISPLTTKGDVATYSSVDARIAVGTNDQVLTAASGETTGLIWAAPDPLTTKGDVMTYDTDAQRLAVGTNGDVLTAASGEATGLEWATPAATYSPPVTTKGDLFTYDSDDQRLAVGTDTHVLTADSAEGTGLKWAAPAAGDPLTTKGDIMGYDTDAARLGVGANGTVLTAASGEATGLEWAASSAYTGFGTATFDPTTQIAPLFEDFDGMIVSGTNSAAFGMYSYASGTGATNAFSPVTTSETNRIGIYSFGSGSSGGSFSGYANNLAAFMMDGSTLRVACAIKMGALPDATNDYTFKFGLGDVTGGTSNIGCEFVINRSTHSTDWVARVDDNTTITNNTTSTAVSTNWINLRIDIVARTSVTFYIEGSQVAQQTTNLPITSTGHDLGLSILQHYVAGAAQTVRIDWLYRHFVPGSARGTF